MVIQQKITPDRIQFYTGETVSFSFVGIPQKIKGRAVLRTNIGNAASKYIEQIEKTETGRTPKGADWHDIAMDRSDDGTFCVTLPLTEVGIFEAKCCFLPADDTPVIWPSGDNFRIKVISCTNAYANGIYCCFTRQFGKWMHLPHSPQMPNVSDLDNEGYTVIPPSGTFRNVAANLDHIFNNLSCRILQLLPIHPVPVSFGRMGRYGSPFAPADYFAVDPALADFVTSATPMEQFTELIDAVHALNGRIFMDIPVNHTSWASKLQNEHPDCFVRDEKNNFINPGAWGIVWKDLCKLDYTKKDVHRFMAKIFLFWCKRGVDGFRCDAGYMLPAEAWAYIVAKVRHEYPDTTFLLEGLGGPTAIQEKLLMDTGLDWGYSELFQNYTRDAISAYYPYMDSISRCGGTLVNFAETHDNDRLAAKGRIFARSRFLVNALLAKNGTFGFANGAEFFAEEKIDVHGCGALNSGNNENICPLIKKLNILLASHPAFGIDAEVSLIQSGCGNVIAALRHGENIPNLLILINLDCSDASDIHFFGIPHNSGRDLLSGREFRFTAEGNGLQFCRLARGEGVCLAFDGFTLPEKLSETTEYSSSLTAAVMAQNAALAFTDLRGAAQADWKLMCRSPLKFVETVSGIFPPPITKWRYPADSRRCVMIPPGDLLLITAAAPFVAEIHDENKNIHRTHSVRGTSENCFAILRMPENSGECPKKLSLSMMIYDGNNIKKSTGEIMLLAHAGKQILKLSGKWDEAADKYVFGSNNSGSYALFNAHWGEKTSKYDAILAVNSETGFPADRNVMFSSCRAWLVIDEYSREITSKHLENYCAHPGNRARWEFLMPDSTGGKCTLDVEFRMALDSDCIEFSFFRKPRTDGFCPQVKLILRPDLEDRKNHDLTKACDGSENRFRNAITAFADGFDFHGERKSLKVRISKGEYRHSPEWRYMNDLPQERYYGMDDKTDLFSPGYFTIPLPPCETVVLRASADDITPVFPKNEFYDRSDIHDIALDALSRFVVRRDGLNTVIAGYPWFLDWGRDTLIVLRGMVKFPELRENCRDIICRFAAFEKSGTIPNMICGSNDSNRDTSDAPLYLITAVKDYVSATGDDSILSAKCGTRTLQEILISIITHYRSGTPNGIKMDEESGLIYSPSHFSWMDTNFPAGTPREGYPVEIQSLWFAALDFLGEKKLAAKVSASVNELYFSENKICDCLHCNAGTSAKDAVPDDHVRCNMLTAITFGVVTDRNIRQNIIDAASLLLIPGAIRTIDDADVRYALPIIHNGQLLNDPHHPYQGHYCGAEDTSRKAAYHNGTAWCWPFPSYCEALYITGGENSRERALALLMSASLHLENGVIGEMPEVADGDIPHKSGGCSAQAWSISEFYRVLDILEKRTAL